MQPLPRSVAPTLPPSTHQWSSSCAPRSKCPSHREEMRDRVNQLVDPIAFAALDCRPPGKPLVTHHPGKCTELVGCHQNNLHQRLNNPKTAEGGGRRGGRCGGCRFGVGGFGFGFGFRLWCEGHTSGDTWPWVKIQIEPPVNIPIPTKAGSKMGGEFTYQPKMGSHWS